MLGNHNKPRKLIRLAWTYSLTKKKIFYFFIAITLEFENPS